MTRATSVIFLVLTAALAVTWTGCSQSADPETQELPAVKVGVTSPQRLTWPRHIRVTGTLLADEETTIAAKVAGRIIAIHQDLGDRVASGQELLKIDPTDYSLMFEERRRAFAESLAKLGLTELPEGDLPVDTLPAVVRARLQEENARARYERGRKLAERETPMISEQDFADLRTEWEVAQSNLKLEKLTAEANLAEARTLEAQIRIAEQKVTDTVHKTPGPPDSHQEYEVAARFVSIGDYVQIGDPLFRLVDANPVKLRAMVPERRLNQVTVDQPVEVRVESTTDAFTGRVARISPAVDPASRTFACEIEVANEDRRLKPGSFATAMIETGMEDVLALPIDAVTTFAGVSKVMIVEDNKAVERRVELGDQRDGHVEIRQGLAGSEKVVARPPGSLVSGSIVDTSGDALGVQP